MELSFVTRPRELHLNLPIAPILHEAATFGAGKALHISAPDRLRLIWAWAGIRCPASAWLPLATPRDHADSPMDYHGPWTMTSTINTTTTTTHTPTIVGGQIIVGGGATLALALSAMQNSPPAALSAQLKRANAFAAFCCIHPSGSPCRG
ncbi:hypothetical protein BU24DRAFT_496371 [Aaosphaeria arxii CBS 175.79]|uniref:Uncharacterized protein n=1 Tax=Aaosphaeria arxii CBS 175.79 TaxID=1450172 RepID=A0A6A5XBK7_9PLEO|nr:uncharacterized protein BU24DRAFT_496371 [Aaosphaeria arxii CBS 175.79]KAF2010352.1 hypothetical protein BU24DRAFT_496371 [Aaosphaeria arxii CBS 175.79]